jgi:tagatose 1,6-diphosphate aldolase
MGVDVLKLQFPFDPAHSHDQALWRAACEEVNAACSVPWTILSGGVAYETFVRQVEIACQAGASGVIAGRAVWNEAVSLQGEARAHFLSQVAHARIQQLASICAAAAAPWQSRVVAPKPELDWYVSG